MLPLLLLLPLGVSAQSSGSFQLSSSSGCIVLSQIASLSSPASITQSRPLCPGETADIDWPLTPAGNGAASSMAIYANFNGNSPGCVMALSQMQAMYLLGRSLEWQSGGLWDSGENGLVRDPENFNVITCGTDSTSLPSGFTLPNPSSVSGRDAAWTTEYPLVPNGGAKEVSPEPVDDPEPSSSPPPLPAFSPSPSPSSTSTREIVANQSSSPAPPPAPVTVTGIAEPAPDPSPSPPPTPVIVTVMESASKSWYLRESSSRVVLAVEASSSSRDTSSAPSVSSNRSASSTSSDVAGAIETPFSSTIRSRSSRPSSATVSVASSRTDIEPSSSTRSIPSSRVVAGLESSATADYHSGLATSSSTRNYTEHTFSSSSGSSTRDVVAIASSSGGASSSSSASLDPSGLTSATVSGSMQDYTENHHSSNEIATQTIDSTTTSTQIIIAIQSPPSNEASVRPLRTSSISSSFDSSESSPRSSTSSSTSQTSTILSVSAAGRSSRPTFSARMTSRTVVAIDAPTSSASDNTSSRSLGRPSPSSSPLSSSQSISARSEIQPSSSIVIAIEAASSTHSEHVSSSSRSIVSRSSLSLLPSPSPSHSPSASSPSPYYYSSSFPLLSPSASPEPSPPPRPEPSLWTDSSSSPSSTSPSPLPSPSPSPTMSSTTSEFVFIDGDTVIGQFTLPEPTHTQSDNPLDAPRFGPDGKLLMAAVPQATNSPANVPSTSIIPSHNVLDDKGPGEAREGSDHSGTMSDLKAVSPESSLQPELSSDAPVDRETYNPTQIDEPISKIEHDDLVASAAGSRDKTCQKKRRITSQDLDSAGSLMADETRRSRRRSVVGTERY